MKGILYSLLIAIDRYPKSYELYKCVDDLSAVASYLRELTSINKRFSSWKNFILKDERANKGEIINSITRIVENLEAEDTFLLYFSGHGAQEISGKRFKEEHNGLLQSVVCFHKGSLDANYLLADKEIKFLLHRSKSNAHIVCVFDCCHSGDITRNKNSDEKKIKRVSERFPLRNYNEFIFHHIINEDDLIKKGFSYFVPDRNMITLSACLSNQSAWENPNGGVFTRNLLTILDSNNNYINYNELIRQTEIAIKNATEEKQTPIINVQSPGKYNQLSSWLNLTEAPLLNVANYIKYNQNIGWVYTKGELNGVREGQELEIKLPNNSQEKLKIKSVNLTDSILHDPLEYDLELERHLTYPVVDLPHITSPKIAINNLDNDEELFPIIDKFLKSENSIIYVDSIHSCDYQLNVFDQLIYFSFPFCDFQPLHDQFDILNAQPEGGKLDHSHIEDFLNANLRIINKWFHFKTINLHDCFEQIPIKVEIRQADSDHWIDVTNGNVKLEPNGNRHEKAGIYYKDFQLRVTNITKEDLYISLLALISSSHEISSSIFNNETKLIEPGNSLIIKELFVSIDHYMEVFNWEEEKVFLKFIVNNHSDLTNAIISFVQEGFSRTLPLMKGRGKGFGLKMEQDTPPPERNAIYTSELILANNTLNQITGRLKLDIEHYAEDEKIFPFIEHLYFEFEKDNFNIGLKERPGSYQYAAKGSGFKIFLGNKIDYARRNRIYKRMLKKYPGKPRIVAEGDSWFLYPILVKDTIDYIMENWPVKSLAWAGDTLQNYKKSGDLIAAIIKEEPKYVLLSGGGNDIIGEEIKKLLLKDPINPTKPEDYLNEDFEPQMKMLEELYRFFFSEITQFDYVDKILVHGYDYIRADHAEIVIKNGWLNKHLKAMGLKDLTARQELIEYLINRFNRMLKSTAAYYPKVIYLNLRGIVANDEWYDEIHPNDEGYMKIANKFLEHIK